MNQGKRWLIRSRNTTGGRTPLAGLLLIFAALLPRECGGAEDEALRHLLLGNELAGLGRHVEAISAWRVAAQMRPDSNVPLNNMANSYLGLEQLDDALREAQEAFRRKTDYMTSVTLSNVHKKMKKFREAEAILLEGILATVRSDDPHEEPFWSLASLYWDQGDYLEFVKYAHLGLEHKAQASCQPRAEPPCSISPFELEIVDKIWNASADVESYLGAQRRGRGGGELVRQAARVGALYSRPWLLQAQCMQGCLGASDDGAQRAGGEELEAAGCKCSEVAREASTSRYARMISVRLMNCDWRHRQLDEGFVEEKLSRSAERLLDEAAQADSEWLFECQDGLVCGAGGQPPLHLWALDTSLPTVVAMGLVQHGLLHRKMLQAPLAPEHYTWTSPPPAAAWPGLGGLPPARPRLHVGLLSSDLLRDHPVGNMMRHALPLHDLSRTEVTVLLIHEQQEHAAQQAENKHLLGDVRLVMLGRGPGVSQLWDASAAQRGAHLVNSLGISILVDLIGYTSDHRQDVLAVRPAPVQVSYHGYMGTTGAPYIDLYMADRIIAPPEHAPAFTERLVLLPECFLGPSHRLAHQLWGASGGSRNDFDGHGEDDEATRRVANGLPPFGPVLCNFNQHFKIDPATFAVWRGAAAELNATLWLLRGSAASERNLAREFAAHPGPGRLVWVERVPVKDHLRRAALCHLALDTLHYNMGATGADTLFASVPVVHRASKKAVGRMMTSMLRALRMEELIARDQNELKAIAVRLAAPAGAKKLRQLRTKLVRRILWAPLFDVAAWVNDMEASLRLIWETYLARGEQGAGRSQGAGPRVLHIGAARPVAIF